MLLIYRGFLSGEFLFETRLILWEKCPRPTKLDLGKTSGGKNERLLPALAVEKMR